MKGVQFVIDDSGKKTAVLIDLSEGGELWEDLYDGMVSRTGRNEPSVLWEQLKAEMELEQSQGG